MKEKLYTDINIKRIDNFLNDHLEKSNNFYNQISYEFSEDKPE